MFPAGDEFEPITECAPLIAELRARIRGDGPISFHDFMRAALYHPRFGYYVTHAGAMSRGGDYVTSPEIHSIFGAIVAKQICELWQIMGQPARFGIVEQGAGTGALARDILNWAERHAPDFAVALRYRIVERLAGARATQEQTLADLALSPDRVEWLDELPAGTIGCILTNELLDAFPVHRVVRQGDTLREVFVTIDDDGRFVDQLVSAGSRPGEDGSRRIEQYFESLGLLPGEGCYAEVNLDAPRWIERTATSLHRGYVLTFDYGYEAAELYAPWRRDGTLLCFHGQSASSDPYQRVGKQDITASIDFTTLRHAGEAANLRTIGYTDQSSFLVQMGVTEGITAIARSRPAEMEEYFARRSVVMALIDPVRLGRIKVLLQGKNVPSNPPRGFREDA